MIKLRGTPWNVWTGITFRFHPLFTLLMLLSVITGYFIEIVTLFVIVLIHELGHVSVARSFGWKVKEVQLLPFGGVAAMEEAPGSRALEELLVALGGPLQNVWMMLVAYALTLLGLIPQAWGDYFIQANALIAAFNLLPVLPLDGGRILQVLIGLWLPYQRTMQVSTLVSLVVSGVLIIGAAFHVWTEQGGILLNWLMIAFFLFYSNWHDWRGTPYRFMRFLLNREKRLEHRGAAAEPIYAASRSRAGDIVRLFMRDKYHVVCVLDERDRVLGIVPERALLDCYFDERRRGTPLAELFA
ncbi:site-2 protease family protein [Paenibacillus sp. YYML68]|uniref:site-2 protease family protein n=1 Tax=Paenibacillus sp. YYML68 TaxID=2909250 RepID=UPI002490D7EE|nr:site-2 protease family protein [Paenibacillus sp. YYML68]